MRVVQIVQAGTRNTSSSRLGKPGEARQQRPPKASKVPGSDRGNAEASTGEASTPEHPEHPGDGGPRRGKQGVRQTIGAKLWSRVRVQGLELVGTRLNMFMCCVNVDVFEHDDG